MPRTFYATPADGCVSRRAPGVAVDRVIIHVCEGTFAGSIAWFGNASRPVLTCSHYLISKAGDICQMVRDEARCLHAGDWNSRSIGIEHEGYCAAGDFPEAMLRASAKVTAAMCEKFGIPADREHIIGHVEVPGATHTDPGALWPWDRYMELVAEELESIT
jgi:N-acetyl-anhydromuramyl-L-alanine amidase AmpD